MLIKETLINLSQLWLICPSAASKPKGIAIAMLSRFFPADELNYLKSASSELISVYLNSRKVKKSMFS